MTADTSIEAWRSLTGLRERQAQVLWLLREIGPSTDEHLVAVHRACRELLPQSPSGIRSRRAELVELGMVRDSGRRERTLSGRRAIVWEASARVDIPSGGW